MGCFPGGASPYGVEEMSGNVWEWTSSLYRPYPYRTDDGREDLTAADRRVVRGGSFDDLEGLVRCAVRFGNGPNVLFRSLGFRLVVVPRSL